MYRSLSSLVSNPSDLLALDLEDLGGVLLRHLESYEGVPSNSVYQNGLISQMNFVGSLEARVPGQHPEYGDRQVEVTKALMEAWNWLERTGILIRDPGQPAPWFSLSRRGRELLSQLKLFEQWEKLGLNRVKSDLEQTGGSRDIGGPQETRDLAWKWIQIKENGLKAKSEPTELAFVAEPRLSELRELIPGQFDFKKLIRLCEELNIAYREQSYFATAMLTRGVLDHVPPLFGKTSFTELANNYSGGGKSFKGTMQRLENAARNIADSHLHTQIRSAETLPTPQQVNFAAELDVLLAEVVRIAP